MRRAITRHKRLSAALLLLVPVMVIVAGWHYFTLYRSLTQARDNLTAAQARLSDVGLNLSDADLAVARERLDAAQGDIGRARGHMKWDPFIQLAGVVPGTDSQVDGANDLLEMADLLVLVAQDATSAGGKAVALRDGPPTGEPLTKSLINLLDGTTPEVDRIAERTAEVVRIRQRMGDARLVGPLSNARERIDEELPKLANAVEQARQTKELLPAFLGFNGDRRYLVLALNSGELLPGGGLVTASGILPVAQGVNGQIEFSDSTGWAALATAKQVPHIPAPGPLDRYLMRGFTWNLLVSNWSPDFPTSSQQALEFYELVHGPQGVQGVIAVDLTVLERLLTVVGPKTIEVEGRGPVTFDSNNAVIELEAQTRQAFDPADDRKSVIGDLSERILADLLKLPSGQWADAVEVVRKLGAERHIQVFTFDPAEQTIIRDFRWDGRLEAPEGDFLHFNEASVMSTKLNLIVKPQGDYRIAINDLGDVSHELRLRYENTLDEWAKGRDPELVRNLMLGGLYGGYLRVFGPQGIATGASVEVDGQPGNVEDHGIEAGSEWFGTLMTLPPGAKREVVMRWRSTPARSIAQDGYELFIQKQPGTDGMCFALDIARVGQPAKELRVTGGTRDAEGRYCLTRDIRIFARF